MQCSFCENTTSETDLKFYKFYSISQMILVTKILMKGYFKLNCSGLVSVREYADILRKNYFTNNSSCVANNSCPPCTPIQTVPLLACCVPLYRQFLFLSAVYPYTDSSSSCLPCTPVQTVPLLACRVPL